ncbi:unnamed protein product [Vitrella brassicaformis CCMP3155]|uniref:Uncharacterized protein n=1 Tax=Vitrella brassicaformis (strain CCMP3155) TaxID=1169540 RepID=A0A0G4FTU8_VITBC|nr:unnamed protein product [Vitrella brassicaformis CCMP3155]|eukprot:CEM18376.1 unnamed protein product [Vitrella brassicaformis CCMP3155]
MSSVSAAIVCLLVALTPLALAQHSYRCPDDYEDRNNKCVKIQRLPPKMGCPDGYLLRCRSHDKTDCSCVKRHFADYQYECPVEWRLKEDQCIWRETCPPVYECPEGYDRHGDECRKHEVTPAIPYCHEGELKDGGCVTIDKKHAKLTCPHDYKLVGKGKDRKCRATHYSDHQRHCPDGYTFQDDVCLKYWEKPAHSYCPDGSSEERGKCVKYHYEEAERHCPAHADGHHIKTNGFEDAMRGLCRCKTCDNEKGEYETVSLTAATDEDRREECMDLCLDKEGCVAIELALGKTRCELHFGEISHVAHNSKHECIKREEGDEDECYGVEYFDKELACPGKFTPSDHTSPDGKPMCEKCKDGHGQKDTHNCVYKPMKYRCPEGTEKYNKHQCVKKFPIDHAYSCDHGYELIYRGKDAKCVKKEYLPFEYKCDKGGDLHEYYDRHVCKYEATKPYETRCEDGYEWHEDGKAKCFKHVYEAPIPVCPSKYDLRGWRCVHKRTSPPAYKCPHDKGHYEPQNGKEVCHAVHTRPLLPECPEPYRYNDKRDICVNRKKQPAEKVCPDGYRPAKKRFWQYFIDSEDKKCVKVERKPVQHYCPDGAYNRNGVCIIRDVLPAKGGNLKKPYN